MGTATLTSRVRARSGTTSGQNRRTVVHDGTTGREQNRPGINNTQLLMGNRYNSKRKQTAEQVFVQAVWSRAADCRYGTASRLPFRLRRRLAYLAGCSST